MDVDKLFQPVSMYISHRAYVSLTKEEVLHIWGLTCFHAIVL